MTSEKGPRGSRHTDYIPLAADGYDPEDMPQAHKTFSALLDVLSTDGYERPSKADSRPVETNPTTTRYEHFEREYPRGVHLMADLAASSFLEAGGYGHRVRVAPLAPSTTETRPSTPSYKPPERSPGIARTVTPDSSHVTIIGNGGQEKTVYHSDNTVETVPTTEADRQAMHGLQSATEEVRAAAAALRETARTTATSGAEDRDDPNHRVVHGNNLTFNEPIVGGRDYRDS